MVDCPRCGASLPDDAEKCAICGGDMKEIECPECGEPLSYIAEHERYYCYECETYAVSQAEEMALSRAEEDSEYA